MYAFYIHFCLNKVIRRGIHIYFMIQHFIEIPPEAVLFGVSTTRDHPYIMSAYFFIFLWPTHCQHKYSTEHQQKWPFSDPTLLKWFRNGPLYVCMWAVVVSQWDEIISERLFHAIYLFVFFIFHTQAFMNTEFKFFMKNLLKVSRCSRNDPSKKNFNSYGKQ